MRVALAISIAGCQIPLKTSDLCGRGLWATYSTRTVFHAEGGKENRPRVVRVQLRKD